MENISKNPMNEILETGSRVGRTEERFDRRSGTISARPWPDFARGFYQSTVTGDWVIDLRVTDPITGDPVTLRQVKVRQVNGTTFSKVNASTEVLLNIEDMRNVMENNTQGMYVTFVQRGFPTKSTAVPIANLKANSRADSMSGSASGTSRINCRVGQFDVIDAQNSMHTHDGLNVFSNPNDPNSGGMAVDSVRGEIVLFNKERNNIVLDKRGVNIKANKFNFGNAIIARESAGTGGLNANQNPIEEMYPSSNILLNIPMPVAKYWPDLATILGGIAMVYKMIKMGEVISDKIDDRKPCNAAKKRRDRERRLGNNPDVIWKKNVRKAKKIESKDSLKLDLKIRENTRRRRTVRKVTVRDITRPEKDNIIFQFRQVLRIRPITLFSGTSVVDSISQVRKDVESALTLDRKLKEEIDQRTGEIDKKLGGAPL